MKTFCIVVISALLAVIMIGDIVKAAMSANKKNFCLHFIDYILDFGVIMCWIYLASNY